MRNSLLQTVACVAVGFALQVCYGVAAQAADTNAPAGLKILSRKEWGANPPVSAMKRHEPKRITPERCRSRNAR
jgi:hypothetical protein